MSQCLSLLDQALDIGMRELDSLAAGEVDGLEEASTERARLIDEAWSMHEDAQVDVDELIEKLKQLRSLQSQLSCKARKLHTSLAEDLKRMRCEGQRLAGYGKASKVTPLFGGGGSRYVSKQG